jgi:hypothetical protein
MTRGFMTFVLTGVIALPTVGAENREPIRESSKANTAPGAPKPVFDGDIPGSVTELTAKREAAIQWCIKVLERPHDSSGPATARRVTVLRLLSSLRASDSREAIGALVDNLTWSDPTTLDFFNPLDGFHAARTLIELGSPTMPDVLQHLSVEHSIQSLRVIAFVIKEIDGPELGHARVELELKRVLTTWPHLKASPDHHVKNLRVLSAWLSNPQFFSARENWPVRHRE